LKNISKNSNANVVSPIEMLFQLNRRNGMLIEGSTKWQKENQNALRLGAVFEAKLFAVI
jgi:hypothetical protein